jgi:Carbonic anhydrases/acetyltransferases, isoleucine patch superfamily
MATTAKKLVVLGAKAFADLHTLIRDINSAGRQQFDVIALLDDNEDLIGTQVCGVSVAGPLSCASGYGEDVGFVFGVNNWRRRVQRLELLKRLNIPSHRFPQIIHPSCCIGDYASVGFGSQLYPFCSVKNTSSVGSFCVFFESFVTSTYVKVLDGSMGGGSVTLLDSSVVEPCSFVGTGAVVAESVTLGAGCIVGAQSLITKNVFPGYFALGNPAKQIPNITLPEWLLQWENASESSSMPR